MSMNSEAARTLVTLRAPALRSTALAIPIRGGAIHAEGDLDFRGTAIELRRG